MGLADPRKRRKVAHDPNNTAWARSTDSFGHRLLSAQGWTPGTFLGAKDAAHAPHYSAASASHVRVLLKEDNLGLGARSHQEPVVDKHAGSFQDILGRLNGKSETQLGKESQARADLGCKLYTQRKFGPANFVRGGFLVGNCIVEDLPSVSSAWSPVCKTGQPSEGSALRAARSTDATEHSHSRDSNSKGAHSISEPDKRDARSSEKVSERRLAKKNKKEKKADRQVILPREQRPKLANSQTSRPDDAKADRRARREERKARKEERKARSLQEDESKSSPPTPTTHETAEISHKETHAKDHEPGPNPVKSRKQQVPRGSGIQFVRQRNILSKRQSATDPQALREILMLKA